MKYKIKRLLPNVLLRLLIFIKKDGWMVLQENPILKRVKI